MYILRPKAGKQLGALKNLLKLREQKQFAVWPLATCRATLAEREAARKVGKNKNRKVDFVASPWQLAESHMFVLRASSAGQAFSKEDCRETT